MDRKEKGFITIATGNKHYYEIAANLLKSYRYFTKNPLPFAIIAEEENEYTALFDDVVLTTESEHSFTDKFLLAKLCPYKENIFVDSDSLAFGDLNIFWETFDNATDFSAIGTNADLIDNETEIWYDVEDVGEYGKQIEYRSRVHAGLMFVRNSDKLKKFYEDCRDIQKNYNSLSFKGMEASSDEAILGLAFPMNGMKAVHEDSSIFACYPFMKKFEIDVLNGKYSYELVWGGSYENSVLCHWGTRFTYEPLYRYNVKCIEYMIRRDDGIKKMWDSILYEKRMSLRIMETEHKVKTFVNRVISKIERTIKK